MNLQKSLSLEKAAQSGRFFSILIRPPKSYLAPLCAPRPILSCASPFEPHCGRHLRLYRRRRPASLTSPSLPQSRLRPFQLPCLRLLLAVLRLSRQKYTFSCVFNGIYTMLCTNPQSQQAKFIRAPLIFLACL